MKPEKFKVVDYIREFIKSLSFNLENFPKKEYELKERIKKNSYDILEIAYEANTTEAIELKINLINKMLAKLKLIDFLLDMAVEFNLLPNKKYLKMANSLADIEKYSRGWLGHVKKGLETYTNFELGELENTIIVENDKKNSKLRSDKKQDTILLSEKEKKELNHPF